jgi:hypothetical protein
MRSLLTPLLLAVAAAQHDGMDMGNRQTVAVAPASNKLPAPDGCKKLNTDADWPAKEVWDAELPGWMPTGVDKEPSFKHPDVLVMAKTRETVIDTIKFVAKHNVRLSIVNSGHDFLARFEILLIFPLTLLTRQKRRAHGHLTQRLGVQRR